MEDKKKADKIGFVNKGNYGPYGNLEWGDFSFTFKFMKTEDGVTTGEIHHKTGNKVLSQKTNKEYDETVKVGKLRYTKDGGVVALKLPGTDEVIRAEFYCHVATKKDGTKYMQMRFGKRDEFDSYLDDIKANMAPAQEPSQEPALDLAAIDQLPF